MTEYRVRIPEIDGEGDCSWQSFEASYAESAAEIRVNNYFYADIRDPDSLDVIVEVLEDGVIKRFHVSAICAVEFYVRKAK